MGRYAAIDIGTNAARLLIGEVVENDGYSYVKKLGYTRVPLRLGMEVFTDGIITQPKTEEFIKSMKAFQLITEVYKVDKLRACATSAMREASNGKEVQQKILNETGLNIEIIDGAEEAEIIFSTFKLLAIDKKTPYMVVDVGGGSTEISVFKDGEKQAGMSFSIGTIRLLKEKVEEERWREMKKWIKQNVDRKRNFKVFATGGNINKVHKVLGYSIIEPINVERLKNFYDELNTLTVDQRMNRFALKPDRADVIVPACHIYCTVSEWIKAKEIFVPKIGLSDGMIYHMHLNS